MDLVYAVAALISLLEVLPMNLLRSNADRVIQAGYYLTGQSQRSDVVRAYESYDQFLWAVVASTPDELAEFAKLLFDKPYIDLPPPLQVAVFRIVGLEFPDDPEQLQLAYTGISMYCTPTEEQRATSGIRTRLNKLSSPP